MHLNYINLPMSKMINLLIFYCSGGHRIVTCKTYAHLIAEWTWLDLKTRDIKIVVII